MRIISWNVNGFRAVERKGAWQQLLDACQPDIVCIQEIKGTPDKFPASLTKPTGYQTFYHPAEKPGYSGTAIWLAEKYAQSISDIAYSTDIAGDPVANEGRISALDFVCNNQPFTLLGVYYPNGGKSEQAWLDKLSFYDAFLTHVNQLRQQGRSVIFCGDVNCAHQPIDLARPDENDGVIGFHPKERAWIDTVIADGWVDIFRHKYPTKAEVYSWWHMVTRARSRNIGWRIDYFFLDKPLVERVHSIDYLMQHQGSDHCPVLLDIDLGE